MVETERQGFMTTPTTGCDLLVISPHTDDAEIGIGGTIATLARRGRTVWAVDLTRGELASNATPDQRWAEAARASTELGLTGRLQFQLQDGFINATNRDNLMPVVWALRTFRPRWVISAPSPRRHPDHVATAELVRRAAFLSRLVELEAEEPAHLRWDGGAETPSTAESWIAETIFSVCPVGGKPSIMFDITECWPTKTAALACYVSQFQRTPESRPTMINDSAFLEKVESRGLHWGRKAGCRYAEAFSTESALVLDDIPDGVWRT
jgi:N-acetylglucosamine malate deacetylase 1